jgi:hypothetical protein
MNEQDQGHLDFTSMNDLLRFDLPEADLPAKEKEERIKDLRDHRLKLKSQLDQIQRKVIDDDLMVRAINLAITESPERLPRGEIEKLRDQHEWSLALDSALYDVTAAYLDALPVPPDVPPTRQQRRHPR